MQFFKKLRYNVCGLHFSLNEFHKSNKYDEIESIVGKNNVTDILHLDSAFKTKCDYFLTPDKKDIVNNRDKLEPLLNMKIFHQDEIELLLKEFE